MAAVSENNRSSTLLLCASVHVRRGAMFGAPLGRSQQLQGEASALDAQGRVQLRFGSVHGPKLGGGAHVPRQRHTAAKLPELAFFAVVRVDGLTRFRLRDNRRLELRFGLPVLGRERFHFGALLVGGILHLGQRGQLLPALRLLQPDPIRCFHGLSLLWGLGL